MKLVLVESPTKARKLTSYLGAGYVVRASIGHIRDLPKSKMGVDIEHDFTPEYLIPKDKTKIVKELKTLAGEADQIILATDPDREGEAIGWHLEQVLTDSVKSTVTHPFVRATFHEITKSAILAAIEHPAELNMALVEAQQARRIVDRLVGYSVSPVLWKKIRYGLSAGRVQSVALRYIVEREREIEKFVPEEYWEVDVLLDTNSAGISNQKKIDQYFKENKIEQIPEGMFVGRVVQINEKEYNPKLSGEVQPVTEVLEKATYMVESVEKKERRRASLPPFSTSTLQQQAANRFGFNSKNTMGLEQQLYEEDLITYHRTDSLSLSSQSLDMAREYIFTHVGKAYLPEQPRFFATTSKNAQEAHEAIRPTDLGLQGNDLKTKLHLTDQHAKLYDLIWRRFLASQMEAAVYDSTTIMTKFTPASQTSQLQNGLLKSVGSIL